MKREMTDVVAIVRSVRVLRFMKAMPQMGAQPIR